MNNVAKSEQSLIQVSAGKEGKRVAMLCEYLPLFDNKGYFITFCSLANNYLFFSRPVLGFKCFSCSTIETPQAKIIFCRGRHSVWSVIVPQWGVAKWKTLKVDCDRKEIQSGWGQTVKPPSWILGKWGSLKSNKIVRKTHMGWQDNYRLLQLNYNVTW